MDEIQKKLDRSSRFCAAFLSTGIDTRRGLEFVLRGPGTAISGLRNSQSRESCKSSKSCLTKLFSP
jgi:hypothetical protein